MIIARIFGWRSSAMNMCSVRHSPMPSAPELAGLAGVLGRVGVRADAEVADLIGPLEHLPEVLVDRRRDERHVVSGDDPGAAVDRDHVTLVEHRAVGGDRALVEVDHQPLRADDRGAAHPARDQRGVRGLAALAGQDPASGVEPGDVLGVGERPDQDHVPALACRGDRVRGR